MTIVSNAYVTLNTSNSISFEGKTYGYYGSGSTNEVLTLKKASSDTNFYRFNGKTKSIHNLTKLSMDGMDFYSGSSTDLKGCYFNETTRDVRQNGGTVAKDWVAIGSYQTKVC